MIGQSVRLTTVRGIEVGIHYSWLLIFFLVTLSLTTRFADQHPHWTVVEHYAVGVATSLLFFVSILLHEFAHSLVALAKGIPVRSITLFVFGGVAQIGREPDTPRDELQIAAAGPLASFLLAAGFWLTGSLAGDRFEHLEALAGWLASINLILAVFNLFPGFPLDGGRILRAAVWHFTGDLMRATGVAARAGQGLGIGFIVMGIFIAFSANWFNGLWFAFIGWFLLTAAQASMVQASLRDALGGLTAAEIMAPDCPTVPSRAGLAEIVQEHILRAGRRCVMVSDDGKLKGLITLHEVKAVPRDRWDVTSASAAMAPVGRLKVITPDTPVLQILSEMDAANVNQIPVMREGRLLGLVTREHLLHVLSMRLELGRAAA
jgi:Zn-dependent protease